MPNAFISRRRQKKMYRPITTEICSPDVARVLNFFRQNSGKLQMDFNHSFLLYNSSNSTYENGDGLTIAILKSVTLAIICLMTIFGNLLVLLAVFINRHLRSTTNYFIVNLACADLLLGCFVLPFSAALEIDSDWPFGRLFCDIWAALDVLCCTASILSLCVISIDRYVYG